MTANDLMVKAMLMLGISDEQGNTTAARYQTIALSAVNTIYADLYYKYNDSGFFELRSHDQIELPERIVNDVMPYGVAAHIATALGDTDNQQFFANLYNQRRKSAVQSAEITDSLPSVEG